MTLRLTYGSPAELWLQALPIGNGRLGAMVFGGTSDERIALNVDTFWSGGPRHPDDAAGERLADLRRLVLDEQDYVGADEVARSMQGPYNESYQPLGDLRVSMDHEGPVHDYSRYLDIGEAISGVHYQAGETHFSREIFASAPHGAIVARWTTDRPGALSFRVRLDSVHPATTETGTETLVLRGRAPAHVAPNYHDEAQSVVYSDSAGLRFGAALRLVVEAGQVDSDGDGTLIVSGADAATFVLVAESSFRSYAEDPADVDSAAVCAERAEAMGAVPYADLRAQHVADYRQLFDRVQLDLGAGQSELNTDDRLAATRAGAIDPALIALFFQYGRYLLISSSRPGTQPANLQGIWNEHVRPPWSSNWTVNINTQMNYWPAEVTNLAECHEPMLDLVEDLSTAGRETAHAHYRAGGWTAHHNVDLWRSTWPVGAKSGNPVWSCWPMAGAWLCQHMWERYAFSGDRDYLAKRAYPVMRGAAEFILDFLVEDRTDRLVTCPSTSPENLFLTSEGTPAGVSAAATMDAWLIRDLFQHCISAADELTIDGEFAQRLRETLTRLWAPDITRDGRLAEWWQDFDEAEPGHRHLSHLWAVYPGELESGEFYEAARKSLDHRLANGGGGTGWSRAWVVALAARFGLPDLAESSLRILLAESTADNLFDLHPPELFQIDGNFGATAGIAEMLLQSHGGILRLLPAVPTQWPTGSVTGLKARGNITVDLRWSADGMVTAALRPEFAGPIRIQPPPGTVVSGTDSAAVLDIAGVAGEYHELRFAPA